MTPICIFLGGFIKNKVYVKKYESIIELKTAISLAFEQVSSEMIVSTMKNFEIRLEKVLLRKGGHVEQ